MPEPELEKYYPPARNMEKAHIKADEDHAWDGTPLKKSVPRKYVMAAFGETLATLNPFVDTPYNAANSLAIQHGGGETNGAEFFAYTLDQPTTVFGGLIRDIWGHAVLRGLKEAGIDTSHLIQYQKDPLGHFEHAYYVAEAGRGIRSSRTIYHRDRTSMRRIITAADWRFHHFFCTEGTVIASTGGICNGLSGNMNLSVMNYLMEANDHGCYTYTDLNFRKDFIGEGVSIEQAQKRNQDMVKKVQMVIGNQADFTKALGIGAVKVSPTAPLHKALEKYQNQLRTVAEQFPNLDLVAIQLRNPITADRVQWGALLYSTKEDKMFVAPLLAGQVGEGVDISNRVGGGDSTASATVGALYLGKTLDELTSVKDLAKPANKDEEKIFQGIADNFTHPLQAAITYGAVNGMLIQTISTDHTRILLEDLELHVKKILTGAGVATIR